MISIIMWFLIFLGIVVTVIFFELLFKAVNWAVDTIYSLLRKR